MQDRRLALDIGSIAWSSEGGDARRICAKSDSAAFVRTSYPAERAPHTSTLPQRYLVDSRRVAEGVIPTNALTRQGI